MHKRTNGVSVKDAPVLLKDKIVNKSTFVTGNSNSGKVQLCLDLYKDTKEHYDRLFVIGDEYEFGDTLNGESYTTATFEKLYEIAMDSNKEDKRTCIFAFCDNTSMKDEKLANDFVYLLTRARHIGLTIILCAHIPDVVNYKVRNNFSNYICTNESTNFMPVCGNFMFVKGGKGY